MKLNPILFFSVVSYTCKIAVVYMGHWDRAPPATCKLFDPPSMNELNILFISLLAYDAFFILSVLQNIAKHYVRGCLVVPPKF